jgi:hypothetical protein
MRSFTLHFSAWFAAAVCILAVEFGFSHTFHPSWADQSNFVTYGLEDNFVPDQMEQIIYQKLHLSTVANPDFVQVGDSSGFFGIIPEVVEQYLPGMKYLNASCCATQGFNGYLALLRFNLRRFPSLKYMVVHSGIIGAFPGPLQWRNAPKTLDVGFPMKTMGEKMETTLNPPWGMLNLPTNSLRQTILQHTFLNEAERNSVNTPTGKFEVIINGLQHRQGYGLEMDIQTGVGAYGPDLPRCNTLKQETFFDWKSLRRKSYLDAFVEEYVALAHEFHVTPILVFQISPCNDPQSPDVTAMRANLRELESRFPELRVPFDVIDYYPENDFSVPLHAQRTVTQETSRRLGRALREIAIKDGALKSSTAPADETLTVMRAIRVDSCENQNNLTEAFVGQCNGKGACDLDLKQWSNPPTNTCLATYIAEFNCNGGPARIVRQETEERFGGRFKLDCRMHDRWPRDGMPQGIQVADASYGGKNGNPMGLVTLRTKAYCDGLTSCDYVIKPPDDSIAIGDYSVRWYCGSQEKTAQFPAAKEGTQIHLACR